MATCPNVNLDSWKNLVAARGEDIAYYLWDRYDGNVPESESKSEIVKAGLKATNALQSDKAVQLFNTLTKNKVTGDAFWNKVQQDLQIPKEQIELLKQYNTTNREELITNMLADYSYAIEINISKEISDNFNAPEPFQMKSTDYPDSTWFVDTNTGVVDFETKQEALDYVSRNRKIIEEPTDYYSYLTVPGGTNYTENEIATPAITPAIKGHAQFATENGIGWFRSDEQLVLETSLKPLERGTFGKFIKVKEVGLEDEDVFIGISRFERGLISKDRLLEEYGVTNDLQQISKNTKTRRILEVQSDLFQKGRESGQLVERKPFDTNLISVPVNTFIKYSDRLKANFVYEKIDNKWYVTTPNGKFEVPDKAALEDYNKSLQDSKGSTSDNKFLQLLNKDNNWVNFFVKSIIQDSAKKGYEKVLFPSGDTASKVEGHTTLEEFKKQKEDRIKELEKENEGYSKEIEDLEFQREQLFLNAYKEEPSTYDIDRKIEQTQKQIEERNNKEINQLKQELERVEKEGFGALKPIYNFYENNVVNVLKKQGYAPKQVTDEYGNTWNEIDIVPEREQQPIFLQKEETGMSKASPTTIAKVKQLLEKMGVSIKDLATYARDAKLDLTGVNGVADIASKIIALAEGKEDVALTEEMVHIATAILEQKNPALITEMISKIDRFQIYQRTLDQYKNNPAYQLPNGKPNIRKIKKEAVDKLIAELIINNNDGKTEFPELMDETNRSIIRTFWQKILDWFRGMYRSSNMDIFQEAAAIIEQGVEGDVIDVNELYYQYSDVQKAVQQRILKTRDDIKKVEDKQATDPILMDTEEASNWYEVKQPDGSFTRVIKRVTDRVKSWYRQRFPGKIFTEEEKDFNEFKRKFGVKGHKFFEEIYGRYFNSDGTRRDDPEKRSTKLNDTDDAIYRKLESYFVKLMDIYFEDGKTPLVFSEVVIYDPKQKEAGTIDLLIVEENGKGNIIDWKFMNVAEGAKDVAWFKQGAYNIQLGRYKDILKDYYGVTSIGMNRAIPILMKIKNKNPKDKNSELIVSGISIGDVDSTKIEDLRLLPVSEESESTGFEKLDKLIKMLNAAYNQIQKKVVTDEDEKEFKRDRLNLIKQAVRVAQGTLNIAPLIDVINIIRKEGEFILDDYNAIYKDKPANSSGEDFTNEKLSDFAANMREYNALATVFGRIDDLIGDLIYNEDMEKEAKTKTAKEEIAYNKKILDDIRKEASKIRNSSSEIFDISKQFADKFIGQRNLVQGLLSAEAVVKGLSSLFRGVSELPMASLNVLFKIVNNAKGRASRDALSEVDKLMEIRKRIVERGGNVRELVKKIYQKDNEKNVVNKLIYKYDKAFRDGVNNNAIEGKRSKKWLLDNIDVDGYKKEVSELLDKRIQRIKKLYDDEDLINRLIREEKEKYDIDNPKFIGWNNPIIKRHPLPKWESKEYIELKKDKDLLDLYNFIFEINQKAKSSGYISNQVASTFLPFVRKSMAESLAWDFNLSAVMNFGKSLQSRADDVGYGKINELTGELENGIPKYYTHDFSRSETGVNDYSDVSEDIFKNMILYINHMEKYKYLSEVEDQLKLVKDIEVYKGYLSTNNVGDVIFDENDNPVILSEGQASSEGNAKIFNDFLRAVLYEQKYPLSDSDTPLALGKAVTYVKKSLHKLTGMEIFKPDENPSATSLVKAMDAANRAFQLKTLGLEFISGGVNAFGANIQIATQAGNYFQAREVLANETKLIGNKFKNDEEREMFVKLIDLFLPLKDDPTYERILKSGLSPFTRRNFSDDLMFFMREPEQHIEKSIFLTLLDNVMIEDGKIVSIREFVKKKYKDRYESSSAYKEASSKINNEIKELKKTRSINAIKKLEDGKLVIPGLDMSNINEIQRLTNLTRRISRNATGNLADSDFNRMGMSIWTKSMMVFKNWIPKLVDTRFGEFRKVSDDFSVEIGEDGLTTGEKYDIGRIRLFAEFLSINIFKTIKEINDVLSVNENGILMLDKLYTEYAEQFMKRTGKPLNMTKEEFMDMIRTNLRNQVKELAILASLLAMSISLGFFSPDDDDDKADKNRFRYAQRVIDKFLSEVSFFYNPAEFQKILSGSMFPAINIFSDFKRFVSHFMMEITGIDYSDPELTQEKVRKKAQPVKNLAKMFPFTKSLITYLAIFDAEFAKEYDVTIQKESRR